MLMGSGLKKNEVGELDKKATPVCTPAAPEYREMLKPKL